MTENEEYPPGSTAKKYTNADGEEVSLYKLVCEEPSWAASMIRHYEKKVSELKRNKDFEVATAYRCGQQQWIPCKERLPEDGPTLTYCPNVGRAELSYYRSEYGFNTDQNGYKATHWMPLPEAPEVGQ